MSLQIFEGSIYLKKFLDSGYCALIGIFCWFINLILVIFNRIEIGVINIFSVTFRVIRLLYICIYVMERGLHPVMI